MLQEVEAEELMKSRDNANKTGSVLFDSLFNKKKKKKAAAEAVRCLLYVVD